MLQSRSSQFTIKWAYQLLKFMKKTSIISLAFALTISMAPALSLAQTDAPQGMFNRDDIRERVRESGNARNILLEQATNSPRIGARELPPPPPFGSTTPGFRNDDRRGPNNASSAPRFGNPEDRRLPRPGSTTPDFRGPERDRPCEDGLASTTPGSTTPGFGRPCVSSTTPGLRNGQRKPEDRNERQLKSEIFNQRKNNLVKQLNQGLNNLKQIRERILSRITKSEQSGRDMTDAKALLVTADAKIATAKLAIDTFAATNPPASTTPPTATSTATSTVIEMSKPRQMGAEAISAVNDARKALNAVVVSIAHSMGFGPDGRPVSTTTPPTATTTTQ